MIKSYQERRLQKSKPPKLRFKPGQFFRNKDQLYCCLLAFRTVDDPSTWKFILEERHDLSNPSTVWSTICETMGKYKSVANRVHYPPIKDSYSAYELIINDYAHGDREVVTNKTLMTYELVSSGEVGV